MPRLLLHARRRSGAPPASPFTLHGSMRDFLKLYTIIEALFFWGVVQSVGHRTVNADGGGSSPPAPAILPWRSPSISFLPPCIAPRAVWTHWAGLRTNSLAATVSLIFQEVGRRLGIAVLRCCAPQPCEGPPCRGRIGTCLLTLRVEIRGSCHGSELYTSVQLASR